MTVAPGDNMCHAPGMNFATKTRFEYTYRQLGTNYDIQLLDYGRTISFGLASTEAAARAEGRDMVNRAKKNVDAGRRPTDGFGFGT
jgi:hypothetical protein